MIFYHFPAEGVVGINPRTVSTGRPPSLVFFWTGGFAWA
jgi:hypothetical protein